MRTTLSSEASFRLTFARKRTWPCTAAIRLLRSSKRYGIIEGSFWSIPSPRWPACNWAELGPWLEKERAKKAYQDYFSIWQGADPEIQLLKRAKSEYTKL